MATQQQTRQGEGSVANNQRLCLAPRGVSVDQMRANAAACGDTLQEVCTAQRLRLERHVVEVGRPVSCTNAARSHGHVQRGHRQIARILAGCRSHMTGAELAYIGMQPWDLLTLAQGLCDRVRVGVDA